MKILMSAVVALYVLPSAYSLTSQEYEGNITFYGFNSKAPALRFVSTFATNIADQGCDTNGNVSMIAHGWTESINSAWVPITISNLLRYRGGCVFFMDYSNFSNVVDYFALVANFDGISAVFLQKFKQIANFDRQYCFGFSFGSRLCIDVGLKLGNQTIARIEVCDPAGPGFDLNVDPKPAAKNVACIHTSIDKGTWIYNCHQNFRMGVCGYSQAAAGSYPLGSHGLCPHFYNLAFTNDFVPNNYYGCFSDRLANVTNRPVKMGYRGNFDRTLVQGDIFVATANHPPYIVNNNNLDNQLPSLMKHFEYCQA